MKTGRSNEANIYCFRLSSYNIDRLVNVCEWGDLPRPISKILGADETEASAKVSDEKGDSKLWLDVRQMPPECGAIVHETPVDHYVKNAVIRW